MKTNTIVVAAFVAVCTLTACSTGTDALENSVPIEGTMPTPEQLSQELIAKMEASQLVSTKCASMRQTCRVVTTSTV